VRQWQAEARLKEIDKQFATGRVEGQRQWYLNRQGQAMMLVPRPGEFWMGEGQQRKKQRLDYSYAIAAKEVTVAQFLQFRKDHKSYFPAGDGPVDGVSWFDAAAYCNWLSKQEGIPQDQWCYESDGKGPATIVSAVARAGGIPNPWAVGWVAETRIKGERGDYVPGMKPAANHLQRTGYRLATEAEWEYACRAGADTGFSFGEPDELLDKYGWFAANSRGKSHPAGALKPNDLGLFDMHGNAWEWCDDNDGLLQTLRVGRGGSWFYGSRLCRAAACFAFEPSARDYDLGLRLARVPVGSAGK
jgi:formylglycine-generating enzyme required for sulfatase activity